MKRSGDAKLDTLIDEVRVDLRWRRHLGGKCEELFKWLVKDLISCHVAPDPTLLNEIFHERVGRDLNGRESRWRREVFIAEGFKKVNGRWRRF